MKLKDFRAATAHCSGEEELVIEVALPNAVLGRTPSVPVADAIAGFDWDSGRVVITPEQPLEKKP